MLPGSRIAIAALQPQGGGNIGADEDVCVVDGCVALCPASRMGLRAELPAADIVTLIAEPDGKRATNCAGEELVHERLCVHAADHVGSNS